MGCFVVAGFVLTSASPGPSAITELPVYGPIYFVSLPFGKGCLGMSVL